MFGIFKTDSEKLVNECYHLNRELFAACRMYARKQDAPSAKYMMATAINLDKALRKLAKAKGEQYAENVIANLGSEDSLEIEAQKAVAGHLLDIRMRMMDSGKMREIKGEEIIAELIITDEAAYELN